MTPSGDTVLRVRDDLTILEPHPVELVAQAYTGFVDPEPPAAEVLTFTADAAGNVIVASTEAMPERLIAERDAAGNIVVRSVR